jgi:hypothetical protein
MVSSVEEYALFSVNAASISNRASPSDSRFRAGLAERRGEITKAAKDLTTLAEAAQSARRAAVGRAGFHPP